MSARSRLSALRQLARFRRNRSGNVAMLFGLLLVPMLGAIGLAVDFGTILTARNLAQVGADAAVLQAAGVARDLIRMGAASDAEINAAMAEAKTKATALFSAYAAENRLGEHTIAISLDRNGQKITARADFTVERDTYLAKIYGKARYESSGVAVSATSLPTYVDVYLAMDNSQSMGLASTQDEMKKLFKAVGCVFGCHVKEDGHAKSNEQAAKDNGIRMRIDVLRDAVVEMINKAQAGAGNSASYRFAMYLMGADPGSPTSPRTQEIAPISGNFESLKSTAGTSIQLGFNNKSGVGDTHLNEQIDVIRGKIPVPGDGSSKEKAKSYLFIITDGLRDVYGPSCTSSHCTGTINPAVCTNVKNKNIIVGVLYTTYLPIYEDPFNPAKGLQINYRQLVADKQHNIRPMLEQCASSGWFFEASDASGIEKAMTKMFEQTATTPALTQ